MNHNTEQEIWTATILSHMSVASSQFIHMQRYLADPSKMYLLEYLLNHSTRERKETFHFLYCTSTKLSYFITETVLSTSKQIFDDNANYIRQGHPACCKRQTLCLTSWKYDISQSFKIYNGLIKITWRKSSHDNMYKISDWTTVRHWKDCKSIQYSIECWSKSECKL